MGIDAQILSGDGRLLPEYARYWQAHAHGFSGQGLHSVPAEAGGLLARALALRAWLRQNLSAYDLIHVHQLWRLVPTLASAACRRMTVPYLIAPHTSLSHWALAQKRAKKALARRLLWNRIFSNASGFHALNDLEAAEIRDCVGPSGPPVFVVPNGVSLAEFSAAPIEQPPFLAQGRLSAADGAKPFILFLARLHTMKGPDLLLEAFALALREQVGLQLVFAGPDFGMLEMLQRRAAELQLLDRIHFLGLVSGSERLWLLQNAVCLCQPSRDEGFSLSILEALAASCPAVISDRRKFPDVARYDAGVIVPISIDEIASALRSYAGNPARRASDGRSGRLLIERSYTWDIVARQDRDMYLQALGRPASAIPVDAAQ